MEGVGKERDQIQRLAMRPLGYPARLTRIFGAQVQTVGMDALVFALPSQYGLEPLQDPTNGALYAMYDIDAYGAPYAP